MKQEILKKVLKSRKNLIVSGSVSTGKTLNVVQPLVEEYIKEKTSLLILDSKEEYINKYYNELKNKNYNIIILNIRNMERSEGWNPLDYPYVLYKNNEKDKALEYIEKIFKTIFYEEGSFDPFWSNTAADFLIGITLSLFEDGNKEEINFNSVSNIVDMIDKKFNTKSYLDNYFEMKKNTSIAYKYVASTLLSPPETKGSILSVVRQKLRMYVTREDLSMLMNKTTFKYENILNKPTAIFVINKDESKSFNTIAAMFIEQIFSYLIENNKNKKFNFILDNFDTIENINELPEKFYSSLARNIKFIVTTHCFDNLISKYNSYIKNSSDLMIVEDNLIKYTPDNIIETIENNLEKVAFYDIPYPAINK